MKVKLPPVDQAKVLIGELSIEELESVITYSRWILGQKKQAEKKAEKKS